MKPIRASRVAELLLLLVLSVIGQAQETTVTSANGNPWDVDPYSGEIWDGGYDAFDDFGFLSMRVLDGQGNILDTATLGGFNLIYSDRYWTSSANAALAGVITTRSLFAPADQNYLRYYDSFTNSTGAPLTVQVFLGGDLGSDSGTQLAFTSSGASFTPGTYWTLTIENWENLGSLPALATDPPVGLLFGATPVVLGLAGGLGVPWAGNGNDEFGIAFQFTLAPGQTSALMNFVYRGMEEGATGPLGQPAPAMGTEQALAVQVLNSLAAQPDLTGLSITQIGQTMNLTVIPEPSTWLLLASGAGLLVLLRRQTRRAV